MKITVLFFANLREKVKQDQIELELQGLSVGDTMNQLKAMFPNIQPNLEHVHIALNEEYCTNDTVLKEGDTLALIPPVSGGSV